MNQECEFIRSCSCFYVVTMNGDFPACRPFGAIMGEGDTLYLATHTGNEVHKQLRANGNIQIIAKKDDSRAWLRVTGVASECTDLAVKQRFLEECPVLVKHYGTADEPRFLVFAVKVKQAEYK